MKKKFKIAILVLIFIGIAITTACFLTSEHVIVLNPKGMIGIKERKLLLFATGLMMIVVVPVFVFTLFFAWRYREGNKKAKYAPDWSYNHLAEILWWGIPFVIILILAIVTWKSSHDLDPYKPIDTGQKPIKIQVVALQWKWLFIYPEQGIATINFVQFPEKTPVNFEITADAPMNSFWIPPLGGQIYAMPAMVTQLHLIANEEGVFRGVSANLSGDGFAGMTFKAKASSQKEFNEWVRSVKRSDNQLNLKQYNQLVKPSAYHPEAFYLLKDMGLFNQIVMKYQTPAQ
ncbi:MAG: ubiquinol oxidase subunit II [Chlamydiota bacterium]